MIFHVSQNPYDAEQNSLALSNTVMTLNQVAVTGQDSFDENAENQVAIEKDNLALKWYISYQYPKWNIIECDTVKDAEKLVYSGNADCFLASSDQVMDYNNNRKLHSIFQPWKLCFAFCFE